MPALTSGKPEGYNQLRHMEEVIADERSVMHNGQILSSLEQLPSEADLAAGDPAKEAEAKANYQAEIERLQGELAKLQSSSEPEDEGGSEVVRQYEDLTRNQLKTLAQYRGQHFEGNATKAELIDLLKQQGAITAAEQVEALPPLDGTVI